MGDPIIISAAAIALAHFVGEHALAHTVGGEFHHLYREFLERWRDGVIAHPRNHDLEEASEKALRGAALVLVLELAGRIEPEKSWVTRWAERQPGGRILAMDLFPLAKDPLRQFAGRSGVVQSTGRSRSAAAARRVAPVIRWARV